MKVTDLIANQILAMLEEDGGTTRIQRNELASRLGCVPSQINYVITHRFTAEQGYLVESRRGGGGFIRIVKVQVSDREKIFHLIHSIGAELDEHTARIILQNLAHDQTFSEAICKVMMAALQDQNFKGLPDPIKRTVRANLMKTMLLHAL